MARKKKRQTALDRKRARRKAAATPAPTPRQRREQDVRDALEDGDDHAALEALADLVLHGDAP